MTNPLRLSLGPVLYYWSRDALFDFYAEVAELPVDVVYLGETVCSKRRSLRLEDWLTIAERLTAAGKQAVLSSLALIEAESELKYLRRLCASGEYWVEANDMGAVQLMRGRPFVSGPTVNVYNPRTLRVLAEHGLRRWVLPVELSRDALADMQAERPPGVETEILGWGHLPLTLSARCFTARSHNLPKDACEFRCLDDPGGRLMSTQEDEPFLIVNGIQTLSARPQNLVGELERIRELGIDLLRVSPQAEHTGRIVDIFHRRLDGALSTDEALSALQRFAPLGTCDGYWHGQPGRTLKQA